jgi:hypothetical protein
MEEPSEVSSHRDSSRWEYEVLYTIKTQQNKDFLFREIGKTRIGAKIDNTKNWLGSFLVTSNQYGFTLIGNHDSFVFIKTQTLVDLSKEGKTETNSLQRIFVPSGKRFPSVLTLFI